MRAVEVSLLTFSKQCTAETQSVHKSTYENQLSSPRGDALKGFPVERSPVHGNFPGPVCSERWRDGREVRAVACGRNEEKRREARREDRSRAGHAKPEARPSEQESPERRSLAASPWLRSVPGYDQLFFTLRANDRYVFSFQGWPYPFVGDLSLLDAPHLGTCNSRRRL